MTVKINADTSDGLKFVSDTSGEIDLQTNGTTKVHMDSSGNLTLEHPDTPSITFTDTTNTVTGQISAGNSDFNIQTNTDHSIDIRPNNVRSMQLFDDTWIAYTGGTERMRIDSDGDLLVATTSNISSSGGAFQVKSRNGSEHVASFQNGVSNGGWGIPFFNVAGSEVGSIRWTASVTNFNTSSDYRLKENVNYTFDATTEVKRLKPCKFNFIGESETVEGFLAHEVSDVVPVAVTGTKDAVDDNGDAIYQGIDQSKLVPLLVKTIQELEERITALENN